MAMIIKFETGAVLEQGLGDEIRESFRRMKRRPWDAILEELKPLAIGGHEHELRRAQLLAELQAAGSY